MLTVGPRLFPGQLRFHPGATAYALLALLAILLALAVVLLARVYVRNVSIQGWADVLVVSDFRAGPRAVALDRALPAAQEPLEFSWILLKPPVIHPISSHRHAPP